MDLSSSCLADRTDSGARSVQSALLFLDGTQAEADAGCRRLLRAIGLRTVPPQKTDAVVCQQTEQISVRPGRGPGDSAWMEGQADCQPSLVDH